MLCSNCLPNSGSIDFRLSDLLSAIRQTHDIIERKPGYYTARVPKKFKDTRIHDMSLTTSMRMEQEFNCVIRVIKDQIERV